MRRLRPLALVALVASVAFAAPALARDVRTLEQVYSLDKAREVRIEIGAGRLRISPTADRKLRASLTVQCHPWDNGCERRAKQLELSGGYQGDTFVLKVEGLPKMNTHGLSVDAVLQVPRALALAIEMGAGQVNVHDLEKNVRVDVGVGEVSVDMMDARVGSVAMDVGLGDARLRRGGNRIEGQGWLSKTLHWSDGAGSSRVSVHIGVGDAAVELKQ